MLIILRLAKVIIIKAPIFRIEGKRIKQGKGNKVHASVGPEKSEIVVKIKIGDTNV